MKWISCCLYLALRLVQAGGFPKIVSAKGTSKYVSSIERIVGTSVNQTSYQRYIGDLNYSTDGSSVWTTLSKEKIVCQKISDYMNVYKPGKKTSHSSGPTVLQTGDPSLLYAARQVLNSYWKKNSPEGCL